MVAVRDDYVDQDKVGVGAEDSGLRLGWGRWSSLGGSGYGGKKQDGECAG